MQKCCWASMACLEQEKQVDTRRLHGGGWACRGLAGLKWAAKRRKRRYLRHAFSSSMCGPRNASKRWQAGGAAGAGMQGCAGWCACAGDFAFSVVRRETRPRTRGACLCCLQGVNVAADTGARMLGPRSNTKRRLAARAHAHDHADAHPCTVL